MMHHKNLLSNPAWARRLAICFGARYLELAKPMKTKAAWPWPVTLLCAWLSGCASVGEPSPDEPLGMSETTPVQTAEFGRLVGTWQCDVHTRRADGGWEQRAAGAKWRWFYVLGGHAVQDIWEPEHIPGSDDNVRGTNLRIYDPQKRVWRVVWIDSMRRAFELYEGGSADGEIVLTREAESHIAKVRFYNIAVDAFDWAHEISPGRGADWKMFRRMHCERMR